MGRPSTPGPRDPTGRFSERVEHYIRYRPDYPPESLDFLRDRMGLNRHTTVADIGSGTGTFTEQLLESCCTVHAVEPNAEMRAAAERQLAGKPGFHSAPGTAEATGLEDGSIDLITSAQAFHWFRVDETRREFLRILRPDGRVALLWNRRRTAGSAFLESYEAALLEYGLDYEQVDHRKTAGPDVLGAFFGTDLYGSARFSHLQRLDWSGVVGRLLSSSYCPMPGHPNHDPLIERLREGFDRSQRGGQVAVEYDTELFHGRPTG